MDIATGSMADDGRKSGTIIAILSEDPMADLLAAQSFRRYVIDVVYANDRLGVSDSEMGWFCLETEHNALVLPENWHQLVVPGCHLRQLLDTRSGRWPTFSSRFPNPRRSKLGGYYL